MLDVKGEFEGVDSLAAALQKTPQTALAVMRDGLFHIANQYVSVHRKYRLKGRPGLNMQSGNAGMSGATHVETSGTNLNNATAVMFWSQQVAKYIKVHEFGATIVPKNGKFLRFRGRDGGFVFMRSVTIPARLKWFEGWERFGPERDRLLGKTLDRVVKAMAGGAK